MDKESYAVQSMKNLKLVPMNKVCQVRKVNIKMNSDILEKEILLEHNKNLSANVTILKNIIRDNDISNKRNSE